ncbi:MAG: EAL domain-containing protein [Betaproteobacteria bacterium]|nr:EAL domain-containing protein [Betaproteobacteria bacterium]
MIASVRALVSLSLRAKLVVSLLLFEATSLAFLVWHGHQFDITRAEAEFQSSISQIRPLFNAALAPALAGDDALQIVRAIDAVRRMRGMTYLVVHDGEGRIIAAEGWPAGKALPGLDATLEASLPKGRFDTMFPLALGERTVGNVHVGITTAPWREAIDRQFADAIFKATSAFFMSVLIFLVVVNPLARRLERLRSASERIAGGDYSIRIRQDDTDDVGLLARAFNDMAGQVQARMSDLEASRQRFHAFADYTYDVELWFGPTGRLLWINKSVERLVGYTPEECLADREFPFSRIHPDDREAAFERSVAALAAQSTGSDFEFRVLKKDGTVEWVSNSWQPIYAPDGKFLGLRSSLNSIKALKDTEMSLRSTLARLEEVNDLQVLTSESLRMERSRLLSLLSAMDFGVALVDPSRKIIYSNPAFAEVWSIPVHEAVLGLELVKALELAEDVVADLEAFTSRLPDLVASRHVSPAEELKLRSGRILRLRVCPVQDLAGTSLGAVLIHEDITLARESETQLAFLAERDPLTGLYNRRRFERELTERMDHASREKQRLALLFFDLDEFKSVNDLFGHRMGDAVLLQVAGEIRTHLRRNEFFARIGGDEFALVVGDIGDEHLHLLADRLMSVVGAMSFTLGEVRLSLTSSLGIAVYPRDAATPQDLIAHADAAMYQAKDAGKNTWRVYRPDHTATLRQRSLVTWNDRIRFGLRNDGFEIHLQGIFDTTTRKRRHHEALVRMRDGPDGKLLLPGAFIGFAEKSNLIIDLDHWVVAHVIDMLAADASLAPVAVNISGRSIDEPGMTDYIRSQLSARGVDPARLYVEITETAAIRDMRDAQRFILDLHDTGCKVCLDDFGAGYSTFAYIKQLPVDVIKIDGLFVKNLARERDNQVFVRAMLDIARGFGKEVVAEAVEDEHTLDILRGYGVEMAQGYVFEMPFPVAHPREVAQRAETSAVIVRPNFVERRRAAR